MAARNAQNFRNTQNAQHVQHTQTGAFTFFEPVELELLLQQIDLLGQVGSDPAGGRSRLALSDADKAGRDILCAWMREAGLTVKIDAIGNIFGVAEVAGQSLNAALMLGSHIDTVTQAGALDGCYGVLAALAVARHLCQQGKWARPLVVAAFTNEEGVRFQPDMLGSLVYAQGYSLDTALSTVGVDGAVLGEELQRIGYAGALQPGSMVPACYLELHVEQGPVLEAEGLELGVVEGVQGISWQRFDIEGVANHAGTTPMQFRVDPGLAAATLMQWVNQYARNTPHTLATVGQVEYTPNLINVIPAKVSLTIDLRDPDEEALARAEAALAEAVQAVAAEQGVRIQATRLVRFSPVPFDAQLVNSVEKSVQEVLARKGQAVHAYRRMVSGAGHDAQMLARLCPAAMIFVPSKGGISHNCQEDTPRLQLMQGAEVLLQAAWNCWSSGVTCGN